MWDSTISFGLKLAPLVAVSLAMLAPALAGDEAVRERPYYRGADLSMLPVLEKAGATFSDGGKPVDLTVLFAKRGCNLIRLRLFVDPNPDYASTGGAVQDLPMVLGMAKRVKAAGAMQLLDLHYSDSWADPSHQDKPKQWADLHGTALETKVYDYTVNTLTTFKNAGVLPEMVQVGNEIAPGMIWPDGQLSKDSESWARFAALINAGVRGVRAVEDPKHPIQIMIHIHGGGREGHPQHFFKHLARFVKDFDLIGLSFYPGDNETLSILKTNMAELANTYHKEIIVAETAYPNRPIPEMKSVSDLEWPTTPKGQRDFLLALRTAIDDVPDHRGAGFIYWYPEAIKLPHLWTWRSGALALFDEHGLPLPSMEAYKKDLPK